MKPRPGKVSIVIWHDGNDWRYICDCGEEDKGFKRSVKAGVERHNNLKHGGKYSVRTYPEKNSQEKQGL